jgi:hypothetical protein
VTGTAVNPSCGVSSSVKGVQFTAPTLTSSSSGSGTLSARCDLTGEPINAGQRVDPDPANPDILTAQWFNVDAFKLARPLSATEGNFGNAPLGLLRNPSISNWDLTLPRRIPVKIGRNGGVRIQFQAYNVFNQVRFTTLRAGLQFSGANATTQSSNSVAKYSTSGSAVIPPRQMGLTVRLDF